MSREQRPGRGLRHEIADKLSKVITGSDWLTNDYLEAADAVLSLLADPANITDEMAAAACARYFGWDNDHPFGDYADTVRNEFKAALAAAFAKERADNE